MHFKRINLTASPADIKRIFSQYARLQCNFSDPPNFKRAEKVGRAIQSCGHTWKEKFKISLRTVVMGNEKILFRRNIAMR